jgi:hypothetical protein
MSRDGHQKKAHWQSGGKRLTLFSWAHAQKQEAARRSADGKGSAPADGNGPSADGKGPPADSNGPSADGKGSPAGANQVLASSSHPQSSGLLGEHLLIIKQ